MPYFETNEDSLTKQRTNLSNRGCPCSPSYIYGIHRVFLSLSFLRFYTSHGRPIQGELLLAGVIYKGGDGFSSKSQTPWGLPFAHCGGAPFKVDCKYGVPDLIMECTVELLKHAGRFQSATHANSENVPPPPAPYQQLMFILLYI